jgi:hypothetical protein
MIRVPTRFASLRPAPGTAWFGPPDSAAQPGSARAALNGLARPAALIAACIALGLAADSVRILVNGKLSPGGEVAGVALLAAVGFCYLMVMRGGLYRLSGTGQLVNLATLVVLASCAPIPLGRSFLPLEFVVPAAALVAAAWPAGLWLGIGSLAVPVITAMVFGYPAGAIFRQAAQAAVLGLAVAGLVKLAAQARELAGVRSELAEVSHAHEGTTQRLRQADELLGALGWRLSVISRMSELASRVAERRPGVASRELDRVRELACEWPGGGEPPAEAGDATSLSAEIHAARNVLAAASVECTVGTVPAGLAGDAGDALAFFVHEVVAQLLGQPDIGSCTIRVCDDGARIRLDLEWDPAGDPSPISEMALERITARIAAVDGRCEVIAESGRAGLRANIPKSTKRRR